MATREIIMSAAGVGGVTYWISTLNSGYVDDATGLFADTNGDIYIGGIVANSTIFYAKLTKAGLLSWQKWWSSGTTSAGMGLTADAASSPSAIYVAGYSRGPVGDARYSGILIKVNPSTGAVIWDRYFRNNSAASMYYYDVSYNTVSNVPYAVGEGAGSVAQLTAYNTSGTATSSTQLGTVTAIYYTTTKGSDLYFTSYYGGLTHITKYGVWQRGFISTPNFYINRCAIDSSNNVYVTGQYGTTSAVLNKLNSSGVVQWQVTLTGGTEAIFNDVAIDSDGYIYTVGYVVNTTARLLIAKYNSSGTLQWQRTLDASGAEYGYRISASVSGKVIVYGTTTSSGSGNRDVLVAQLPADGTLTGTYGVYTYAASTLTVSTLSVAGATTAYTTSSPGSYTGTPSPTVQTGTFTLTETILQ